MPLKVLSAVVWPIATTQQIMVIILTSELSAILRSGFSFSGDGTGHSWSTEAAASSGSLRSQAGTNSIAKQTREPSRRPGGPPDRESKHTPLTSDAQGEAEPELEPEPEPGSGSHSRTAISLGEGRRPGQNSRASPAQPTFAGAHHTPSGWGPAPNNDHAPPGPVSSQAPPLAPPHREPGA